MPCQQRQSVADKLTICHAGRFAYTLLTATLSSRISILAWEVGGRACDAGRFSRALVASVDMRRYKTLPAILA